MLFFPVHSVVQLLLIYLCMSSLGRLLRDFRVAEALSPGQAWVFPSLQAAARYCEDQFLALAVSRELIEPARTTVSLEEILEAHASQVGRNMPYSRK